MKKSEYNELFDLGISLRDQGIYLRDSENSEGSKLKFMEAAKIFELLYPIEVQDDKFNKTLLLGSLYKWLGHIDKAFEMFLKGVTLNPDSELASLSLYLSYVDLDKSDLAIEEISRFLKAHSAVLYKDTLSELLLDVEANRLPRFKSRILELARMNEVSSPL
ncbi:MAG: hypothetical protein RIF46_11195 [Cyclobacteriaceae bacterium]